MPSRFTPPLLKSTIGAVTQLRDQCLAMERGFADQIAAAAPEAEASARNLLHYLALRQQDLRELQPQLSWLGLSSLGRLEAHTLAGLDAVLAALHKLANRDMVRPDGAVPPVTFQSGGEILARNTEQLLGVAPAGRDVRIMVTMPSEAASEYVLVRGLLEAGMDVMRINCAHDSETEWALMIANLDRARRELGRRCRVLMDLGGPKLRTGPIEESAEVVRWKPRRGLLREVLSPAKVWVTPAESPEPAPGTAAVVLPVSAGVLEKASAGDELQVEEPSGRLRSLTLGERAGRSFWASAEESATVQTGATVRLRRKRRKGKVGTLPRVEAPLLLREGDRLIVTRDPRPGGAARRTPGGDVLEPAHISCTLPEVFDSVKAGHRIFFDDGKIGGVVRNAAASQLEVEITQSAPSGAKLRSDKGINLPDTDLDLPPLTPKDLEHLAFAARHADMVGLSFVRSPEDVLLLERSLDERGGSHLGIVLKIETRLAFEQLPRLLLVGMQSPPLGVMVARGDLAVEMGFDRLAEVQEQILWLCEAAHVPVIWATQVLESLAKKGQASRAEVTDAAMAVRAECVMLNKGPYVTEAVRFLDNVLQRMQLHQRKKRAMLRKLTVSQLALMPTPEVPV